LILGVAIAERRLRRGSYKKASSTLAEQIGFKGKSTQNVEEPLISFRGCLPRSGFVQQPFRATLAERKSILKDHVQFPKDTAEVSFSNHIILKTMYDDILYIPAVRIIMLS
jgi:hypothetical protein